MRKQYCFKSAQTQTNLSLINLSNYLNFGNLSVILINNLLDNLLKRRNRYKDEFYDFAMLLYLTSNKSYSILRQVLPFPSPVCLHSRYGDDINKEKEFLTQLKYLPFVIDKYRCETGMGDFQPNSYSHIATLAIDAFSFRSFGLKFPTKDMNESSQSEKVAEKDIIHNNGFVFLMIPLDYHFPPKILHIETEQNGAYNKNIDNIATECIKILHQKGIRIWFKATDGDPYLSSQHKTFFNQYVKGHSTNYANLTLKIWEILNKDNLIIPIGDPLHHLKNIRSRYISNKIKIFPNSNPTNYQEVQFRVEQIKFANAFADLIKSQKVKNEVNIEVIKSEVDWVYKFLKKHELKLVKPDSLDISRAQASCASNILFWFDNIFTQDISLLFPKNAIFNMDEMGINWNDITRVTASKNLKRPVCKTQNQINNHFSAAITFSTNHDFPMLFLIIGGLLNVPQVLKNLSDEKTSQFMQIRMVQ